jgi:hypothetical protein
MKRIPFTIGSFSESFVTSGKQEGTAVLGEKCSCFSECKQLRRSSCSSFSSTVAGAVPISTYR